MKQRSAILVLPIALLVVLAFLFWPKTPPLETPIVPKKQAAKPQPLFVSPKNEEETAYALRPDGSYPPWRGGRSKGVSDSRWLEVRRRQKADKSWDWKMPINFYGKVVDERGQPVEGADIEMGWNSLDGVDGVSKFNAKSDRQGLFSLTNARGKCILIRVAKEGYYTSSEQNQLAFEYASFWENNFHEPDPNNPVIFHLKKKGEAGSLIYRQTLYGFKPDGTPYYLDLKTGKKTVGGSSMGNLEVQFIRTAAPSNSQGFNWLLILKGVGNTGLMETSEEFAFTAPESGYLDRVEYRYNFGTPDYKRELTKKYYVREGDGKLYARLEASIIPKYNNESAIDLKVFLNPSGSRNLEYDPAKEISK